VSTQVFTVACDTRCGRFEVAGGMVQDMCHCMHAGGRVSARVMPAMGIMCKDLLCKDDSALITKVFAAVPAEIALMPVWVDVPARSGRPVLRPLDVGLRRSSAGMRAPDSLVTRLRI